MFSSDFDYTATWPGSDGIGFWNNTFIRIYCQMSADSTHGFKNIRHGRNVFINCDVWDAAGAQINSNLHADSRNCLILGGDNDLSELYQWSMGQI